jgi:hypothetical protein
VADFPIDPNELRRGLDMLRGAIASPGQDVIAAIDRLTAEVAKLNANIERAMPVIESFEQHVDRVMPLVDSLQQAGNGLQSLARSIRGQPRRRQQPPEPPRKQQPPQGRPPEGDVTKPAPKDDAGIEPSQE